MVGEKLLTQPPTARTIERLVQSVASSLLVLLVVGVGVVRDSSRDNAAAIKQLVSINAELVQNLDNVTRRLRDAETKLSNHAGRGDQFNDDTQRRLESLERRVFNSNGSH